MQNMLSFWAPQTPPLFLYLQLPNMENNLLTSVHQRKPTKKAKQPKKNNNNNPIKVVYISNPMKVKTSASQFRALVQELTGQDSELPDPTKFSNKDEHVGGRQHQTAPDPMTNDDNKMDGDDDDDDDHSQQEEVPTVDPSTSQEQPESSSSQFEPYDDVFTPQMIDNFSGLLPNTVFYDSPQLDVLRRLDTVWKLSKLSQAKGLRPRITVRYISIVYVIFLCFCFCFLIIELC